MQIKLIVKSFVQIYLNHLCAENKIDTEAFLSLTDTMVKELIPLVGDRCKFCNKYKQLVLQPPEISEPIIIDGAADVKFLQATKTPVDNFEDDNGENCL